MPPNASKPPLSSIRRGPVANSSMLVSALVDCHVEHSVQLKAARSPATQTGAVVTRSAVGKQNA